VDEDRGDHEENEQQEIEDRGDHKENEQQKDAVDQRRQVEVFILWVFQYGCPLHH
jgi:hypothetical protein